MRRPRLDATSPDPTAHAHAEVTRWTSSETATPQVFEAIRAEEQRQRDELELIASENYTSAAVMEAVGSVLTNKYAEGLPGRRYYGGCEFVDTGRAAGHRPGQGALRRRARQRPAPLGRLGQPGGLLRRAWRSATPSWRWTWPRAGT